MSETRQIDARRLTTASGWSVVAYLADGEICLGLHDDNGQAYSRVRFAACPLTRGEALALVNELASLAREPRLKDGSR